MGKTYRRGDGKGYDDDRQGRRRGNKSGHSNGRKTGGMRVINDPFEDDDYFDDDVKVKDFVSINKYSDEDS